MGQLVMSCGESRSHVRMYCERPAVKAVMPCAKIGKIWYLSCGRILKEDVFVMVSRKFRSGVAYTLQLSLNIKLAII